MKKHVHLHLFCFSLFISFFSHAQVTLVSDNTGLYTGFVLPNGNPILRTEAGQLYTTNGTAASLITNVVTSPDSASGGIFKNVFYFAGTNTSNDVELWVTDGTAGGTKEVQNIAATGSSTPSDFFVFNNKLYFTADDGINGRELWSTDGSTASLVTNIDNAATSSIDDDVSFFQNGNNVFFTAKNANKQGLYTLTSSGISLVKESFGDNIELTAGFTSAALGNKTIFSVISGDFLTGTAQLWVTDGTANGTTLLKDFGAGSTLGFSPMPVVFNNLVYFSTFNITTGGSQLWTTDGTANNTKLFKDMGSGSFANLITSVIFNGKLFFGASTEDAGYEMWATDGSAANTKMFADINPGSNDASPAFLFDYGTLANLITTGTNFNIQKFYTPYKGRLYFTADDGTHGIELWSTNGIDGTAANTSMVKDINPNGNGMDGVSAGFFTTTGIYIAANDGSTGTEPWLTDGTSGGTNRVFDVNPQANGSDPNYLFVYKNQLYFDANNGNNATLTDLYKIDNLVTVLPVSLLNFEATLQQQSVKLSWTTTNETNTSFFSIERSTDGNHFNGIGQVAAAGNSSVFHSYQYNDADIKQLSSGTLYYRLRTVDKDGKASYSSILNIQIENGTFTFRLSPNPVRNQLTVSFSVSNSKKAALRIFDNNGKQLYQQSYTASTVQQNINVSSFVPGTYYLQLVTDKEVKTLKFLK